MGAFAANSAILAMALLGLGGAAQAADYQRVAQGPGWLVLLDQISYEDKGGGVSEFSFDTFTALPDRDGAVRERLAVYVACADGLMRPIQRRRFDRANQMISDVKFPASRWRAPGALRPMYVSVCNTAVRASLRRLGGKTAQQVRFEYWERRGNPKDRAGQAMLLRAIRGPSAPPAQDTAAVEPAPAQP